MSEHDPVQAPQPDEWRGGIVSVNSRGGSSGNLLGKVFFVCGLLGLMLVAGFYGYNKYRAAKTAQEAAAKQTGTNVSKPAQAGIVRDFEKEQATADQALAVAPQANLAGIGGRCADGSKGTQALGPDNMPLMTGTGVAMRVCSDGHVIVPDIDSTAQPGGLVSNSAAGARLSRYAGDALISSAGGPEGQSVAQTVRPMPNDPAAQAAYVTQLVQQAQRGVGGLPPGGAAGGMGPQGGMLPGGLMAAPPNPPGSVGSQLTPSTTPMVTATMLGDRNMILPKGRSIDCGLSMRLVSDLPGLASCVLSQNVYSDNGKVLLLERGSEAVGEYSSALAQGQRRLFVLWTRVKTPSGVVISLDSPGADDLGTSGLPGRVNNHWWQRLGAAFLLTIVQDAIAYKTAQASNAGGAGGVAVYQNTAQAGNDLAAKVLESTINIKPTLYKNQGDRGTIYVARDLDFSSVYALRPR
jgi:type IV secretion system protein VirB10